MKTFGEAIRLHSTKYTDPLVVIDRAMKTQSLRDEMDANEDSRALISFCTKVARITPEVAVWYAFVTGVETGIEMEKAEL
jgi:hypothetical protein